MRSIILLTTLLAVSFACLFCAVGPGLGGNATTRISAAKFVSPYPDDGVIHQRNVFGDRAKEEYDDISNYGRNMGYSNAFIVKGPDFEQALLDTHRTLFGNQSCSSVHMSAASKDQCWLFVSLGSGLRRAEPRVIGPLELDRKVRVLSLSYEAEGDGAGSRDYRGYVYWVPLGRLEGDYTIRLIPRGTGRPTLTRTVRMHNGP